MKWKANGMESTPAGIPSGGMLMLIGRKHVNLLTTLTGTHDFLMVSICPGLTSNNNYFYELYTIEECRPGVLPQATSPMAG